MTTRTYTVTLDPMSADALFCADQHGEFESFDSSVIPDLHTLLKDNGHGAAPVSITWEHFNVFEAPTLEYEGEQHARVATATVTYAGDVVVHVEYLCWQ